jgi:hypothetical protein
MNYQQGDSVYLKLNHKTYTFSTDTWALADPDSGYPKITIMDTLSVVKVNATVMSKVATGKFESQYQLASDAAKGKWTGYVETCNSTYKDRQYFDFIVE